MIINNKQTSFISISIVIGVVFLTTSLLSQTLDPTPPLNVARSHLSRAQAFEDKTMYPRSTNPDGTIKRVTSHDWTSGFFPGSLWLMYENTKDPIWKTRAEQWTTDLEWNQYNKGTHDVGFMLFSSCGQGFRLTDNQRYKSILLGGAKSLATRFNPVVGCIKSWDNIKYSFPVIIDNMMNLEILFWATKVSGDSSYYKIAKRHALTTIANHFRSDNSSFHLVDYDPVTGKVISKQTVQGLSNLSDWARGQAWGLYGFTMSYRETRDTRFLTMAMKIADFYLNHPKMPEDLVPFWDFDASDYRDVSAACIASSALLELSQFVPEKRSLYYNFGINILKSVSSSGYTAAAGTNNDFILKHGVGSKPAKVEVDKPLCYADYYFIEALLRHKKPAPILKGAGGNNQVNLKWNASTGARYYSVKRSTISGGPYTTIASNVTATKFANYGLSSGKTYYYRVTSWNYVGEGRTSSEVRVTTNKPPTVNITSPANNAVYTAPARVTINAIATDADGTIANVKFYNRSTYLKTEFTSPYTCILSNLPTGTYTITAVATDNWGARTTSAPITVGVVSPPSIVSSKPSSKNNKTDVDDLTSMTLAPNPARNVVTIYAKGLKQNQPTTISVLSSLGALMKTMQANSSTKTVQLDVSNLVGGVYTIKLLTGNKILYKQFVKL